MSTARVAPALIERADLPAHVVVAPELNGAAVADLGDEIIAMTPRHDDNSHTCDVVQSAPTLDAPVAADVTALPSLPNTPTTKVSAPSAIIDELVAAHDANADVRAMTGVIEGRNWSPRAQAVLRGALRILPMYLAADEKAQSRFRLHLKETTGRDRVAGRKIPN